MAKYLVIVESPTKAKTISKFLGKDYDVIASFGHIRDLPKSKIGVDVEGTFEPEYEIPAKAKKQVTELKKKAKGKEDIFLATDVDREGEAIAWHVAHILKLDPKTTKRIAFHEITKAAIKKALDNPGLLNQDVIDAQQARRVLDRIVGYELSPLLWKKIRYGLSAGRVQSIILRLIIEREEERRAFKEEEYWSVIAECEKDKLLFPAQLTHHKEKRYQKLDIKDKKAAEKIVTELKKESWTVKEVEKKETFKKALPPLKTSTLQRSASVKFGYTGKQTMALAQRLYEGKEIGTGEAVGLITYMRTDSLHLASQAVSAARTFVEKIYGKEFLPKEAAEFKTKAKGAQEAHEAIRPTDITLTPEKVKPYLEPKELKIYTLIWQRTIASQMEQAIFDATNIVITAGDYTLKSTGQTLKFEGFLKVTRTSHLKETLLPEYNEGDEVNYKDIKAKQHYTQPPARYTEASLIKVLEEHGIGRPSTYAPTMSTIQDRGYVDRDEQKRFFPQEVGEVVNELLKEHFPDIVDIEFTASIEGSFDHISHGKEDWHEMIKKFYKPFHKNLEVKDKEIKKEDLGKTDKICKDCGKNMMIKFGRFGKFYACSAYPECKYTEKSEEEAKLEKEHAGKPCPDCSGGSLTVKNGRFGPFLGCSNYPECKHLESIETKTGATCPLCEKGDIIEKKSKKGRTFYACNQYPKCKNALWNKPTGENCPKCKQLLTFANKTTIQCANKDCDFTKQNKE